MSIKLTETQTALLSAAWQRDDRLLTLPSGGKLAQARKAAGKLIEAGFVRKVKAKGDAPAWWRDEDAGCDYALKLTAAGLKAIAAFVTDDVRSNSAQMLSGEAPEAAKAQDVRPGPERERAVGSNASPQVGGKAFGPRAGSKIAAVIGALGRAEGATIDEIIAATGWLPHTTRAALTGLRKRGYALTSDRTDRTRGSIYRIAAAPPSGSLPYLGGVRDAGVDAATIADDKHSASPAPTRARRLAAAQNAVAAGPHEAP